MVKVNVKIYSAKNTIYYLNQAVLSQVVQTNVLSLNPAQVRFTQYNIM